MTTINDVFKTFPFRSVNKFAPKAAKYGFSRSQAIAFLRSLTHDKKFTRQTQMMLPIYSRRPGGYQMDTLEQTPKADPRYFLVTINFNSRKLYAYPMRSKDSSAVLAALKKFTSEVDPVASPLRGYSHGVTSITTDQDSAYLSTQVTRFMLDHHIDHQTTFEHDHNRLGIINRAIKTLRDINRKRDFTEQTMKRALYAYNNSLHSSTGKEPNEFTAEDEEHYIQKKTHETDEKANKFSLDKGAHVRVMTPPDHMTKKRSNLSMKAFKVAYKMGNKYVIRANDGTASEFPRYQLIQDDNAKLAKSMRTKRAIINDILSFSRNKYKVRYDTGKVDTLPVRSLREGRPTRLSPLELSYWRGNKKHLPQAFKAFLPM